jgi:hypothetical protein
MSKAAQKAWYKKNNMEMPDDMEGRSAAAAKRVKIKPRKEIAIEPGSIRAINAERQKAYMGRPPIGAMGSGGSNVMAGAGQSTIKDLKASIKAGYNPKVSLDPYESERAKKTGPRSLNLKKKSVEEASKPDASMAMTHQPKMKMINDKDKRTLGKVVALMAAQKNKDKKNEYVRQLGLKAMKAGEVDPARGHSPTRFGREVLKKEEVEQINEIGDTQKGVDRLKKYLDSDRSKVKFSDVATARKSENPEKAIEKLAKRQGYKAKAMKKVREFGKVKTPYKPKELYQIVYPSDMKYHGDSVELNGPVINEVTKQEAETVLGGPVKTKPKMPQGKQPAGYRYVRLLARKAMKTGLKKEEVEQIDEANKSLNKSFMPTPRQIPAPPEGHLVPPGYERVKSWGGAYELRKIKEKPTTIKDTIEKKKMNVAAVKNKLDEKLDPVGHEDKDIDNDGDLDKTDVYLHTRRKAIGNAIRKKITQKMGKKYDK